MRSKRRSKRRSTTTLLWASPPASPPASVVLSVRKPLETTTNDDCVAVVKTHIIKGLLAPFELSTEAPPESSSSNQGNKEMEMITRSQERAGSQEMDQTRWKSRDGTMCVCLCHM
ncbi:hypothetical protein YC2023_098246 [Brassica napus]